MAGYHGAAWVRAHDLNPDKAQSIEIVDHLAFFRALAGPSPMAITHELAHAYCDRVLHDDPSFAPPTTQPCARTPTSTCDGTLAKSRGPMRCRARPNTLRS